METAASNASQPRRILRLPEVELRTGFKRAHIYKLMSQGLFPHSVSLGSRAVGWDSLAIQLWVEDRITGQTLPQASVEEKGQ